MHKYLVVSLQRAQNDRVLTNLVEKAACDLAVRPDALTPALRETSSRVGTHLFAFDPVRSDGTAGKAQARSGRVALDLESAIERYPGVRAFGASAVAQSVLSSLNERLAASMDVVDLLDDLRDVHPYMALLVNETDQRYSRTATLWARAHLCPSFLISSRTNLGEPTTVTRKMLADYVFVFGERAAEPYLDMGVPAERIVVTGNPAWDHYGEVLQRRGYYRSEIFSTLKLRGGIPLAIFATTWNARLSALHGADIYEQTVRAFLRACKQLKDAGNVLNAVIKDLPGKAEQGRRIVAKIAAEEAYENYTYADGEMPVYLCAADVLVGHDASVFVEAMMASVPAVNIWCPASWLVGPAMDRRDGVPMVRYDDTPALVSLLRAATTDAAFKQRLVKDQKSRFGLFHVPPDGRSAERCANEILKRLPVPARREAS